MSKARKQRLKEYNKLLAMRPEVEKSLLQLQGIISVNIGSKITNDTVIDEICFRIYVAHKKDQSEIPQTDIIPRFINGIRTDVNEYPKSFSGSANPDSGEYRPLAGGIMISSSRGIGSGTLGCLAIDDDSKAIVLLTCYHVLMANGEEKGHQVGQPDFCCDRSPCRCGEVAKLDRGFWDEKNVDCAIAKLSNENENNWTNDVLELGPVSSIPLDELTKEPIDPQTGLPTHPDGSLVRPVLVNDTVFMRGKESRVKEGVIIEISDNTYTTDFKTKNEVVSKTFKNQLVIKSKIPGEAFSSEGDSGAVIINHLNQVVGLVFAAGEFTLTNGTIANVTLANPIQDVLQVLKISIPDTIIFDTLPLRSAAKEIQLPRVPVLEKFTSQIKSLPDGPFFIDLFKKHNEEIQTLINNNREIKIAWNRFKGPAFVACILEKTKNPTYQIPLEIEGLSYQRLLTKMSIVLEKNACAELARDIEKYSVKTFRLIQSLL